MKKTILYLILLCFIITGADAQDIECTFCAPKRQTKTQSNFNATYINHRHIVTLKKGGKMIVELYAINDYDILQDIGEVLSRFREGIRPLKDSLETSASGHLRIDYSYNTASEYRKIRIKKYDSDGDIFLSNKGDVSQLKVEQDSIRILIEKQVKNSFKGVEYKYYRPVQVTLVLNNYTEIDSLIKNQADLQHFIDTMKLAATPKHKVQPRNHKTTINFHPYPGGPERFSGKYRFIFYDGIVTDEYVNLAWLQKFVFPKTLAFVADMGAGLVRNKLAPTAEAGFEYRFPWMRGSDFITIARIIVSSSFLFDKTAAGDIAMYDNWFINAEMGTLSRESENRYILRKETVGVGYMFRGNNIYLPGTTMKAYINFPIGNQFSVTPEVIFTNDLRTVFPGVTFKGFLNRD